MYKANILPRLENSISIKVCTKRESEKAMSGRIYINQRPSFELDNLTVEMGYDLFRIHMEGRGYREKTIKTYDCHIKPFIQFLNRQPHITGGKNPKSGGFPLSVIQNFHIELYMNHCRGRKNKDTTIQSYVKSIRTFLYWCMNEEQGYIKPYKIKLPSADEALKEPYTEEELDIILAAPRTYDLTDWRDWAALNTIIRTGIRLSSAVNLKWQDIDYENSRLKMRHSKNRKEQFVPLPRAALEVLRQWQYYSQEELSDYVFFSTRKGGGKISPNGLYQAIRKHNLRRGVEKTSVHLLRHTYATTYLQKGGRAEKLQKILGHQTPEMTQRYVHFVTDDLVKNIDDFTI